MRHCQTSPTFPSKQTCIIRDRTTAIGSVSFYGELLLLYLSKLYTVTCGYIEVAYFDHVLLALILCPLREEFSVIRAPGG